METVVVTRPMQWGSVPDITSTTALTSRDKDCFREIRDVLEKYDCLDRFGVSLIHRHFDIGEDEYLLETVDEEARTLTVTPVRGKAPQDSIETQWQLVNGAALTACHGYCTYNSGHRRWHQQGA